MKCKHVNRHTHSYMIEAKPHKLRCTIWLCLDCNTWLPFAPSNDTPEVQVEIRAAELGNGWTKERGVIDGTTLDEDIGFLIPDDPRGPEQLAGYLARVIATHDEQETP